MDQEFWNSLDPVIKLLNSMEARKSIFEAQSKIENIHCEKLESGEIVFAVEYSETGQRYFIKLFDSSFCDFALKLPAEKRSVYEVITGPCKLFLDIEKRYETTDVVCEKGDLDKKLYWILNDLHRYFLSHSTSTESCFAFILNCSYPHKYSKHVVFSNVRFEDIKFQQNFLKKWCSSSNYRSWYTSMIDFSVYTKNRNFRLLGSSKYGKEAFFDFENLMVLPLNTCSSPNVIDRQELYSSGLSQEDLLLLTLVGFSPHEKDVFRKVQKKFLEVVYLLREPGSFAQILCADECGKAEHVYSPQQDNIFGSISPPEIKRKAEPTFEMTSKKQKTTSSADMCDDKLEHDKSSSSVGSEVILLPKPTYHVRSWLFTAEMLYKQILPQYTSFTVQYVKRTDKLIVFRDKFVNYCPVQQRLHTNNKVYMLINPATNKWKLFCPYEVCRDILKSSTSVDQLCCWNKISLYPVW